MLESSVVWFNEIGLGDISQVGGKNASLGEMVRALSDDGVKVPDGFATTANAYRAFIAANGIEPALRRQLDLFHDGRASLRVTGEALRELFLGGEFPADIADGIRASYRELSEKAGHPNLPVAVRSSATAEDLPDASFAGQQETFLNVTGERDLLDACRRCYASLFTDRAIPTNIWCSRRCSTSPTARPSLRKLSARRPARWSTPRAAAPAPAPSTPPIGSDRRSC